MADEYYSGAYTGAEIDAGIAAAMAAMPRTEAEAALAGKADKSTTYTKTEVDTLISDSVKKTYYTATSVPGTSTLSSTGVTYTVPAGDICRITATIMYNGSAPSKIQVKFKSMVIAETSASGNSDISVSAVGVTAPQAADQTVEVFGQWASTTGTNTVILLAEKLN